MSIITPEKITNIITLYNNGHTIRDIKIIEKISRPTIRKILRINNLRDVKKKDVDHSDTLNLNFFDKIDTEEKAYYLGLMYADGNNYIGHTKRKHYMIRLCLQERDKLIIEKFRDLIAPQHLVKLAKKKTDTQQAQYQLRISSKIISDQLTNLGCVPNKSLILQFPNYISNDLLRHFIRGYFDGDGCFSKYLKYKNYYAFGASVVSTFNFCKIMNDIFKKELNINFSFNQNKYIKRGNNITTELTMGGNHQVYKLMKWLYNDAIVYLDRKYQKYKDLENIILK